MCNIHTSIVLYYEHSNTFLNDRFLLQFPRLCLLGCETIVVLCTMFLFFILPGTTVNLQAKHYKLSLLLIHCLQCSLSLLLLI